MLFNTPRRALHVKEKPINITHKNALVICASVCVCVCTYEVVRAFTAAHLVFHTWKSLSPRLCLLFSLGRSVGDDWKFKSVFFFFFRCCCCCCFPEVFMCAGTLNCGRLSEYFHHLSWEWKCFSVCRCSFFPAGWNEPRESWNPPLDRLLEAKMSYWRNDPNVLLKIQVRQKKTTTSILFYSSIFNSPYFFFLFSVGIKKLKFSFIPPKENNAVRKRGAQTMGRFFSHRFFVLSRLCFSSLRRRRRWERRMRAGHPNPKYAYRVVVGGRAGRMGLRTLGHLIT